MKTCEGDNASHHSLLNSALDGGWVVSLKPRLYYAWGKRYWCPWCRSSESFGEM